MGTGQLCSIDNCGKRVMARGWCSAHYSKWRKYGDPLTRIKTPNGEQEKFYQSVVLHHSGDGCLVWPFPTPKDGYARIWWGDRKTLVSRRLCAETHGSPSSPNLEAAHSCGNGHKGCVSKHHISWKTCSENQADRLIHGTDHRGEKNTQSKLTERDVRFILSSRRKVRQRDLAERFNVSISLISNIQNGWNWKWFK